VRLRPLSEAECYARCYGGRTRERVNVLPVLPGHARHVTAGERMRELFEERLDRRGTEVHKPAREAA
jgi:hypothetical protein